MKPVAGLFVFALILGAKAIAQDSPDTVREENFHRIYEKYNAAPTPLEAWEQASAARQSEVYKVQRGDTLWDLSRTLFGDPHYWPKVWALNNDEVYNPHEIETWMQIRFYPGDLNEPPTVSIAEAPAPPTSKGENALIPPPRKPKPPVAKLPKSIPLWQVETVTTPLPALEAVQPIPHAPPAAVSLGYTLSEQPVGGVGQIKETELGLKTASEFQYVFVEVDGSSDRIFTVIKDIGMVPDPSREKNQGPRLVEIQGEIEILEPVSESRNLRRAIVRRNIAPIEVGAWLVPGRIQTVSTEDAEPTPGPSAKIIGAPYSERRSMTDPGGFVFLNAGSSGGLREGMTLSVHSNVRARQPKSAAVTNDRVTGHARVVHTTDNYAVAILTKVNEDIIVGDTVGGNGVAAVSPELQSAPSTELAPDSGTEPGLDFEDEGFESMEPPEEPTGEDELTL